jgi:hypothetical protein
MGLAAYGQPKFFDPRFVGNQYDWKAADLDSRKWLDHCLERAGPGNRCNKEGAAGGENSGPGHDGLAGLNVAQCGLRRVTRMPPI